MGPLVRCYVALRLPASLWPKLAETQMTIRRKSMSDAMRWHGQEEAMLTLCALGEQPWEMVKRATSVLGPLAASHAALNLRLEGLVGSPNNTQPRYLEVTVAGDVERLAALQADVARALAPMLSPTEKAYQPRVVLGRLRIESEQARTALGRALRLIPAEPLGHWTADALDVLRADASTAGVRYETIERFPLAAPIPA